MKKQYLLTALILFTFLLTACNIKPNLSSYELPKKESRINEEFCLGQQREDGTKLFDGKIIERVDENGVSHKICSYRLSPNTDEISEYPVDPKECFKEGNNLFMSAEEALDILKSSDCKYKNEKITDYGCNAAVGAWNFSVGYIDDDFRGCRVIISDKTVQETYQGTGTKLPGQK